MPLFSFVFSLMYCSTQPQICSRTTLYEIISQFNVIDKTAFHLQISYPYQFQVWSSLMQSGFHNPGPLPPPLTCPHCAHQNHVTVTVMTQFLYTGFRIHLLSLGSFNYFYLFFNSSYFISHLSMMSQFQQTFRFIKYNLSPIIIVSDGSLSSRFQSIIQKKKKKNHDPNHSTDSNSQKQPY